MLKQDRNLPISLAVPVMEDSEAAGARVCAIVYVGADSENKVINEDVSEFVLLASQVIVRASVRA